MTIALQKFRKGYAAAIESRPEDILNARLAEAGISKKVHSYVMTETQVALEALLDSDREALRALHNRGGMMEAGDIDAAFFAAWRRWTEPVLALSESNFPFAYTTSGANEALREIINAYGHQARIEGFSPAIHVFDGEHDGFASYAAIAGIPVVTHSRATWRDSLVRVGARDQFYLSQPSAIDGNLWAEFSDFVTTLGEKQPAAKIMLDLTYVGCVARNYNIDVTAQNISTVLISLSKPLGLDYHRIGGVMSRKPYPGLAGQRSSKNLLSLKLGIFMMQRFGIYDLPKKYALLGQQQAVSELREKLGMDIHSSDVFLLATAPVTSKPHDLEKYLRRGTLGLEPLRLCLTPAIERLAGQAAVPVSRRDIV